ncbi:MAG: hypothetical protein OHK93_006729 [Ramalina farinacea]|uniref:Opioid growth factor receptor (OGFr) conserved domain-containing protein n=1 Tax=Ramalina farinacea TaxID=258253 RepID=A0AA43QLE1_9LECA|nr:hypothetical protein [Ramalina farinacea]
MTTPLLIRFYDPTIHCPDPSGHSLPLLLSWPDPSLERSHTYIQTLFPLPEPSPVNPSAPVITRAVFLAFRTRPELRAQLLLALVRMLQFYGFDANISSEEAVHITRSPNFAQKARKWGLLTRFSHNHLRITRIIRSLRVLGCEQAARAFYEALVEVGEAKYPGVIGERSLGFWRRAVERPLWVRPEDEDEGESERVGGKEGFLWEFERGEMGELRGGDGEVDMEEKGKGDGTEDGKEDWKDGGGEGEGG